MTKNNTLACVIVISTSANSGAWPVMSRCIIRSCASMTASIAAGVGRLFVSAEMFGVSVLFGRATVYRPCGEGAARSPTIA